MLSDPVVSLLIQIPLVGIFVWFTLQTQKQAAAAQDKRDTEWRIFLREQREANNAALSRLAEEIKSISTQNAAMQSLMLAHDQRVQMAIPKMEQAMETVERKTAPRPRARS